MTPTYLFGPDMMDFRNSLFRKTVDEEVDVNDACRFFNDDGEPVFLLADGIIWNDHRPKVLMHFSSLMGDAEYVMTLDEETMLWCIVRGERCRRPKVTLRHRATMS